MNATQSASLVSATGASLLTAAFLQLQVSARKRPPQRDGDRVTAPGFREDESMSDRPHKRPRNVYDTPTTKAANIRVMICGPKTSWMPVQIVSRHCGSAPSEEHIVFEFGIWGPMYAPIFQHVFEFKSLEGMRVETAVGVLRCALDELEGLGVPVSRAPPEDKTKRTFQVFSWYLHILLGVSETHQHRDTALNPLFWRIGPPGSPQ